MIVIPGLHQVENLNGKRFQGQIFILLSLYNIKFKFTPQSLQSMFFSFCSVTIFFLRQTASTLVFCLYFLARSAEWQTRLYDELRHVQCATHSLQVRFAGIRSENDSWPIRYWGINYIENQVSQSSQKPNFRYVSLPEIVGIVDSRPA